MPHDVRDPGAPTSALRLRPRRPPRSWVRRLKRTAIVTLLLLALPMVSLTRALTYPGNAPTSVRLVEWIRDSGGSGIVDAVENWWYTRHPPPATGLVSSPLQSQAGNHAAAPATLRPLPVIRLLTHVPALAGEGTWHVVSVAPTGGPHPGRPTLLTTWFRPDPRHTPVVVGVALLPRDATSVHLVAGTREPIPGLRSPEGARVPPDRRAALVAVFNAGFKTRDSRGGWYAHGKVAVPLVRGAASLVISNDGTVDIHAWKAPSGRVPAGVEAVRQNLALIVQHGAVVSGLDSNAGQRWGSSRNQFQYTWRSGIGVDAAGDLLYVAGRNLTLTTLARALADSGALTGMELDIHSSMVAFTAFTHGAPPGPKGYPATRLLAAMPHPLDRYLVADQRDFFFVTTR